MAAWSGWAGGNSFNFRAYLSIEGWSEQDGRVDFQAVGGYESVQAYGSYFRSRLEYQEDGGAWQEIYDSGASLTVRQGTTAELTRAAEWFTRVYGRSRTIVVQHWLSSPNSSLASFREGVRAQETITVPARPYSKPRPPRSVSMSYAPGDSGARISWSGDYDSSSEAQPWTGVDVYRSTDGGQAIRIDSLPWSSTNYTDSSISDGHRYSYSVASRNSAGSSQSVSAGTATTLPTAFSEVTLATVSTSSARLSAQGGSAYYDAVEVQVWGGGAWGATTTHASLPVTVSVSSGTAQARVRKVVYQGGSTYHGPWATSNTVTTIAEPLAPSVRLAAQVVAAGDAQQVLWTPNHPDGSEQESAEVELTRPSGAQTTYMVSGMSTTLAIPASALPQTGSYRVRVRTRGLWDGFGAWSSPAAFSVATPPTVSVTSPGSVVSGVPIDVSWYVSSSSGVSAQALELLSQSGESLWSTSLSTSARKYSLTSEDYSVSNLTTYSVRVSVTDGSGLTRSASRQFRTSWTAPGQATATVSYDQAMSAHVLVTVPGGTVTAAEVDVARVDPDGTVRAIGTVAPGQTVIDRLPPLNVRYQYRLVARASSGSTSTAYAAALADSDGMELYNFGPAAATALALGLDAQSSESVTRDTEYYHFALGRDGDMLPTAYTSGEVDVSGQRSYVLTDVDEYRRARSLSRSREGATCWYRDAWGNAAFGVPSISTSYQASAYGLWTVSVSFTECVWEDPVG